jgi:precorrin-2 dehydrogenase/sirohydrochlorin ferrochelatase
MRYYPIFLDIQNRKCLVVGGGAVATRKALTLLDCGAKVIVVSPEVSEKLRQMADGRLLTLHNKTYETGDLEDMFFVIGATDDSALNHRIYQDAERLGKLCNIADQPEICNFILPSIINRGDLTIAVSTAGKSPAFAKKLRQDLERQFGEEYGEFLALMGAIRKKLLKASHDPEAHKPLFEKLITEGLLEKIKSQDISAIDTLLHDVLGEGFEYRNLVEKI